MIVTNTATTITRRVGLLFLLATLLLSIMGTTTFTEATVLNIVSASCGSRIPMDSLHPLESQWSLQDMLQWRNSSLLNGISFGTSYDISAEAQQAMTRVAGLPAKYLTLFELDATWWSSDSSAPCVITWAPTDALFIQTTASAASVAVAPYLTSGLSCPVSVFAMKEGGGSASFPVLPSSASQLNSTTVMQQTILYDSITWPVSLTLSAPCKVYVLLTINREVPLTQWWAWIPATVYTCVVVPIALFTAYSRKHVSAPSFALLLGLTFIGYLGSCIGLMVSLSGWQVTSGRMFPFPDSVTFYICFWAMYVVVFLLLLPHHPCRELLFNGVLRCLVYGLIVGHIVAYWTLGYVTLGSVGVALMVGVNILLATHYVRFVSLLSTATDMMDEFRSMPMVWLAPLTPFVPSVMLYADLFYAHHTPAHQLDMRLREAATLYNIQTSLPVIVLFEGGGIALLVAATVRQPTFLVALFMLLLLVVWHTMWIIEQYFRARRQWGADQTPMTHMLWPSIHALVDKYNLEMYKRNQILQGQIQQQQQQQQQNAPRETSQNAVMDDRRNINNSATGRVPPPTAVAPLAGEQQQYVRRASSGQGGNRPPSSTYTPTEGDIATRSYSNVARPTTYVEANGGGIPQPHVRHNSSAFPQPQFAVSGPPTEALDSHVALPSLNSPRLRGAAEAVAAQSRYSEEMRSFPADAPMSRGLEGLPLSSRHHHRGEYEDIPVGGAPYSSNHGYH